MHLFITGSKGFTGLHFAKLAQAAGHTVYGMQSDLTDAQAQSQEVLAFVQSLPPGKTWGCLHLAALSHITIGKPEDYFRINTLGTEYLLSAIVAAEKSRPGSLQRVLLASSANVYGLCPFSPIPETQVPTPINHYAVSKLAMEHIAKTYAAELPIVLLRPFNYTGTGQHESFLIPKLVAHFSQKLPQIQLGNLDSEREFNSIDFVCEAYLHLLQSPDAELLSPNYAALGHGIYNICTEQMYSLNSVLALFQKITGHEISIQQNPALIRNNELKRLGGDASKLKAIWPAMPEPNLELLLRAMLRGA